MAVTSFDDLLKNLHENSAVTDADTNHIEITSSRRFVIPDGFEKTIAYEGDVNSQIITFIAPLTSDNHDLSKCTNKKLRWINLASGNEGSSVLTYEVADGKLKLFWAAPAEAFTKAGDLSFSISFFDYGTDGKIAYSWNTAECSELVVGASLEKVGLHIGEEKDEYIPAKDEVLTINAEKRSIVAPSGYRPTICNYGDVNTSVVYFQIKRYVRGIDMLGEGTILKLYSKLGDSLVTNSSENVNQLAKELSVAELGGRDSEGMVTIIWRPSREITSNTAYHIGKFRIQLEISTTAGQIWRTSPYDGLEIGESDLAFVLSDLPAVDPVTEARVQGYAIDGSANFENLRFHTIAGYVKLREFTASKPILLNRNELAVEYDSSLTSYVGVKVGLYQNQPSDEAPYVTVSPSATIRLYGGSVDE